jgi:hypothetical protein
MTAPTPNPMLNPEKRAAIRAYRLKFPDVCRANGCHEGEAMDVIDALQAELEQAAAIQSAMSGALDWYVRNVGANPPAWPITDAARSLLARLALAEEKEQGWKSSIWEWKASNERLIEQLFKAEGIAEQWKLSYLRAANELVGLQAGARLNNADIREERDALREKVRALRGYVRHKSRCAQWPECDCGLAALLAQVASLGEGEG